MYERSRTMKSGLMMLACATFVLGLPVNAPSAWADSSSSLAGTRWQLIEFQSMDDSVGVTKPDSPGEFTMTLNEDGSLTMRLGCNRATGSWSSSPASDGTSGRFRMGPLAMTRALCPEPNLDEQIARDAEYVRGYLLRDGNLYLSLMADAGIYAWAPLETGIDAKEQEPAPQGEPRAWQVSGVSSSLNMRERPDSSAQRVSSLAPDTLLSNLGCRETPDGSSWCDVQPLGGGARGWVAADYLAPAVGPDGSVPRGDDDSAYRAGQGDFDATGTIPCAQQAGQPTVDCSFGVARAGGGYATVVVTRPDGTKRALYFQLGRAMGADTSQADGYPPFSASKESDLHIVRVGKERYEIPDAVILGG